MSVVLADIGGTHARFACLEDGKIGKAEKFPVADFKNLEEALEEYSAEKGTLYIATAAWPYPDGVWRFARPDRWVISKENLERAGWDIAYIGNDFSASARGAISLSPDYLYNIQAAAPHDILQSRVAVLGSGTGLGLAYVDGSACVQETYGGHMDVPHRTDGQHTIIKLIGRIKGDDRPVSAEDIISGPGLSLLYKASCMVHGQPLEEATPEIMLDNKDEVIFAHPLRLYHEFLGMFAHQAVIYGHSYAGLYLDGGVLHRLVKSEAFDTDRFLEFFIGDPLPLIKKQMQAMKVNIITDPFVALRGLVEMMDKNA